MKVAALWSGGKDSCLASYDATLEGYEVSHLLSYAYEGNNEAASANMQTSPLARIYNSVGKVTPSVLQNLLSVVYNKDLSTMIPHEVSAEIIDLQAQAMGIPLIQGGVRWDTIEQFLKCNLSMLKKTGVEGLVFGVVPPHYPIDSSEKLREYRTLLAHKEWMNRLCLELDLKPITPLWERSPEQILSDLVEKGFEAIIIVVNSKYFGEEWLGRKIDMDFIKAAYRLEREKSVHIGGSGYHTLVLDGPSFKKSLKIVRSRKIWKNGYGVLEISKVELQEKGGKHQS
jgi:uncharacterized protein (TIGR00290 family)